MFDMSGKVVKVAVDAMGGDYAPREMVRGAIQAASEQGVKVVLIGRKVG